MLNSESSPSVEISGGEPSSRFLTCLSASKGSAAYLLLLGKAQSAAPQAE